jgi:hypothetical protein
LCPKEGVVPPRGDGTRNMFSALPFGRGAEDVWYV